jgi:hypothetical protein
MNDDYDIIIIPIAERTIVVASAWANGDGISIRLDNGAILQIYATDDIVKWELEEAP